MTGQERRAELEEDIDKWVNLSCEAQGHPEPTIIWTVTGSQVQQYWESLRKSCDPAGSQDTGGDSRDGVGVLVWCWAAVPERLHHVDQQVRVSKSQGTPHIARSGTSCISL